MAQKIYATTFLKNLSLRPQVWSLTTSFITEICLVFHVASCLNMETNSPEMQNKKNSSYSSCVWESRILNCRRTCKFSLMKLLSPSWKSSFFCDCRFVFHYLRLCSFHSSLAFKNVRKSILFPSDLIFVNRKRSFRFAISNCHDMNSSEFLNLKYKHWLQWHFWFVNFFSTMWQLWIMNWNFARCLQLSNGSSKVAFRFCLKWKYAPLQAQIQQNLSKLVLIIQQYLVQEI